MAWRILIVRVQGATIMIAAIVAAMAGQAKPSRLAVRMPCTAMASMDVVGATTHGGMKCQQASSGD
jgi:hypothetical protein